MKSHFKNFSGSGLGVNYSGWAAVQEPFPPPLFFCDRAERVKTRGKDVSQVETNVSTT